MTELVKCLPGPLTAFIGFGEITKCGCWEAARFTHWALSTGS